MTASRQLTLCTAVLLAGLPVFAAAQTTSQPTAPLPALITSATRLFLGNAGDQENADCLRAYTDFYQGLSGLGRFQLTTDPNAADLILELHYEIDLGQAVASNDTYKTVRQFRLVLLDPKSHTVLWSLTERTNYALLQKNRNNNLDETIQTLLDDFTSLTSSKPPNNKSKVTHPF